MNEMVRKVIDCHEHAGTHVAYFFCPLGWEFILTGLDRIVHISEVEDPGLPVAVFPLFEFRKDKGGPKQTGWTWANRELHWNILRMLSGAYLPVVGHDVYRGWDTMQEYLEHATTRPYSGCESPEDEDWHSEVLKRYIQNGKVYPWKRS